MESNVWNAKMSEPYLFRQTPTGIKPIQFQGVDILNRGDIVIVTAEVDVCQGPENYEMTVVPKEIIAIGHIDISM